jgi:hypothetical protein
MYRRAKRKQALQNKQNRQTFPVRRFMRLFTHLSEIAQL